MSLASSAAHNGEVCAYRLSTTTLHVHASVKPGHLELIKVGLNADVLLKGLPLAVKRNPSVLLLGPESYTCGLIPTPLAEKGNVLDAVKWTFAKDSDIDMGVAICDFLHIPGSEMGGALLKDSHWIFAIDPAQLTSLMKICGGNRLKIEVVDTVATAQRNLCFSEIRHDASRDGGYVSMVVGDTSSSINVSSWTGDLLFHKQMEWSAHALRQSSARERMLGDVQRNLGYFERRLASFSLVRGIVFGQGAEELSSYLTQGLGAFEWSSAKYPEVSFPVSIDVQALSGDNALLMGALMRWI